MAIRNSKVKYSIYSGAGNDFVMIDNLGNVVPFEEQKTFTEKICNKYFPEIDGVIFLDKPLSETSSIRMNYYNRDGSYGAMCGNGARCISKFAYDNGILTDNNFILEAVDKIYKAEIIDENNIRIGFPPPSDYKLNLKTQIDIGSGSKEIITNWVAVGSEHIIVFIDEKQNKNIFCINSPDEIKINEWGKILRFHADFAPKGGNVNFVQVMDSNKIRIRTYERGVERETLACGTGVISSSVVSALLGKVQSPVNVLVQNGDWLTVDFNINNTQIENLSLEGPAKKISEGEIEV